MFFLPCKHFIPKQRIMNLAFTYLPFTGVKCCKFCPLFEIKTKKKLSPNNAQKNKDFFFCFPRKRERLLAISYCTCYVLSTFKKSTFFAGSYCSFKPSRATGKTYPIIQVRYVARLKFPTRKKKKLRRPGQVSHQF